MYIDGKFCLKCNNLSFQVFPESFHKFADNFPDVTNFLRLLLIVSLWSSQKSCILTLTENRINGPDRLYGNVYMVHVPESSQSDYSILRINIKSGNNGYDVQVSSKYSSYESNIWIFTMFDSYRISIYGLCLVLYHRKLCCRIANANPCNTWTPYPSI